MTARSTSGWRQRLGSSRVRNFGYLFLLLFGVGLMVGAPLLAQDDAHHDETDHSAEVAGEPVDPAATAYEETHGEEAHGDGHGDGEHHGGGGSLHFPTLVRMIADLFETAWRKDYNAEHPGHPLKLPGQDDGHGGKYGLHSAADAKSPVAALLWRYEDVIYSLFYIFLMFLFFRAAGKRLSVMPGKLQNLAEMIVGGLDHFIREILGPQGSRYVPFLGTLGLYIYIMNTSGVVPFMKAPTAILETTAALALVVFLYVQWIAVRSHGVFGYLHHLAGEPRDVIGWCMAPLMFPLHVIGEIAKPLSLALRLFGNMMGKDLLLVVFAGLGVGILSFTHLPIGVPLHLPFLFLGLLVTAIQAAVFMLLSAIYISLVLPHEDHH